MRRDQERKSSHAIDPPQAKLAIVDSAEDRLATDEDKNAPFCSRTHTTKGSSADRTEPTEFFL